MVQPVQERVMQSLQVAEGMYHRLVLLVGESGSGKTGVLQDVATDLGTSVINVNLELSRKLLELSARQRSTRLPAILGQIADEVDSPIVLDNLEILFDTSLQQDPLRLLEGISRNRAVLASWSGTVSSGKLTYAEVDHPEYRKYESVDALVVGMDNSSNQATQLDEVGQA